MQAFETHIIILHSVHCGDGDKVLHILANI
jgi:hypothetical protein